MRCVLSVIVCLSLSLALSAQSFNFAGFSGTEPVSLNGQAAFGGGGVRVAPAGLINKGSTFHTTAMNVASGFDTTFSFQITVTSGSGGSGMAFVIQNDVAGTAALGDPAHALGYAATTGTGLSNCLVLEMDCFQDANKNDPSSSHLSLHTNGTGANDQNENFSIGSYVTPGLMNNGAIHTVRVQYIPGTINVYYDGSIAPVISVPYDFNLGGTFLGGGFVGGMSLIGGQSAYVGFSASMPNTTAQLQHHDLLSWSFASSTPPTYPGNTSDFDCSVNVNGVLDGTATRVLDVNALDAVSLHFDSPGGGTHGQFFSAFYQLFFTGSTLTSQVIPGETPPGGFWLDTAGTNPGFVSGVVPYLDGIGFGASSFLAPVLLPGGFSYSFYVPAIIGGQGVSLMLQGVIVDPGLNGLNFGIDDCIELRVQ